MLGEFNLDEILKQFLGQERADPLAAAWRGDRYASFENAKTKETPLVFLVDARQCRKMPPAFSVNTAKRSKRNIAVAHAAFPPPEFLPVPHR